MLNLRHDSSELRRVAGVAGHRGRSRGGRCPERINGAADGGADVRGRVPRGRVLAVELENHNPPGACGSHAASPPAWVIKPAAGDAWPPDPPMVSRTVTSVRTRCQACFARVGVVGQGGHVVDGPGAEAWVEARSAPIRSGVGARRPDRRTARARSIVDLSDLQVSAAGTTAICVRHHAGPETICRTSSGG